MKEFPRQVQKDIGYALQFAEVDDIHPSAKHLKGFKPTIMEIVADYRTDTFRAVYTTKIGKTVYVLHCFQKKSKTGIKTPKKETDMIEARLKQAIAIDKERKNA